VLVDAAIAAGAKRFIQEWFPPQWLGHLAGSLGELMSRSQRISNRKLRANSSWAPKYPSVREGWRAIAPNLLSSAAG
jgi:2-alkyl-3-oxoalkanoate reductase